MTIPEIHAYLFRARQDLWAALKSAPPEALSQPMLPGPEFHCIKDLLFHIIAVQDGWVHEDILRQPPILASIPELNDTPGGPNYAEIDLQTLLHYWQSVHESTSKYLTQLTEQELRRVVTPHDAPNDRFTVDGLLWHVMIHEMRHTAQIAMLLRQQGIKPPSRISTSTYSRNHQAPESAPRTPAALPGAPQSPPGYSAPSPPVCGR